MRSPLFINTPVLSLQTMLREISFQYPSIPRVTPDGVFGERTLEAVMVFQREFFPPVTGMVNNDTWDAIAVVFQRVRNNLAPPLPCTGFPSRCYTIHPGEACVHLYLIQAMYRSLAQIHENIEDCPVDGVCHGESHRNTLTIQQAADLPTDGIVNKDTWDALSRLYTVFVTYAQTPWQTREESLNKPPAL